MHGQPVFDLEPQQVRQYRDKVVACGEAHLHATNPEPGTNGGDLRKVVVRAKRECVPRDRRAGAPRGSE